VQNRRMIDGLASIVERMCVEYRNGEFAPLLEDDIVAYLYSKLLAKGIASAAELHVKTRAMGLPGKKVDLVVGSTARSWAKSASKRHVDAALAVEVKFLYDDTNPGQRANFPGNVKDDITKLRKLGKASRTTATAVVMADEVGHVFAQSRAHVLQDLREAAEQAGVALLMADFRLSAAARGRNAPPGVRLRRTGAYVRTYKGKTYHLKEAGPGEYVMAGRKYTSLTDAAKDVTGYENVSGPRWWGKRRG